jgi:thiol-disulfide isomerase/thioredoxin
MKYSIANYLMVYYAISERIFKQNKPEIFNTDFFPVNDDSAIVSSPYFTHLNNYVVVKYINGDSICQRFIKNKDTRNLYTRIFGNLSKHEKPGLSRDIMIYQRFCDFLSIPVNDTLKQDLIYLWASFSPLIKNSELLDLLREKKSDFERQGSNKEIASNLKSNSKSETIDKFWETVHSKYKGKIIYIDIWATWCDFCRTEISPAIVLHDQFRDKPIAFINLCLLSDKDDWEKLIKKSHLTGDNYFFNEDESNLLRDELKFVNYPTYMIIDKNGNLIEKDAPRPSSRDEIKNMLNNLLEK